MMLAPHLLPIFCLSFAMNNSSLQDSNIPIVKRYSMRNTAYVNCSMCVRYRICDVRHARDICKQ